MNENAQTPPVERPRPPGAVQPYATQPESAVTGRSASAAERYTERLYAPWWCWPLPVVAAALLAAEVHLGYQTSPAWLPYLIATLLAVALMLWLGRYRVRVLGCELYAGSRDPARLPLEFAGELETIDAPSKRQALGPDLDPAAFVLHRPWVGPMLRIHLTDPDDPTPYWLVSTRSPGRLAEVIRAERDTPEAHT